jgi:hypothetical protein
MQTKLNGRETTSPKNPRLPVSSVSRAKKMQRISASTNSASVPKGRTNLAGIEHEQVIMALEYLQSKGMSNYHLRKLHHAPEQMKRETFNAAIRYLKKKCGIMPGTQNYYDRILYVAKEHADTGADFESLTHAAISRYPYEVLT